MYRLYTVQCVLFFNIFCCASEPSIGIDITNPGLSMWQLITAMYTTTVNVNSFLTSLSATIDPQGISITPYLFDATALSTLMAAVTANGDLLADIDATTLATLDAVRNNGSCIAQIMQAAETNQQNITTQLDELAADDAKLFSVIESVDTHVLQTCKAVTLGDAMLKAKMNVISCQITECCEELAADDALIFSAVDAVNTNVIIGNAILTNCCEELSENDAKIFSALESLDNDVDNLQVAVTVGNAILSTQINGLSYQIADCCEELSENDAKIFSAVDRIDTTLSSIFCAAQREQEAEMMESPTAPHQVKFISNKHVNRAGGITITEPGLYILTEALNIDAGNGILVIQAENVTLDLNGFTITANAEKTIPLSITQSDLVTIKNGTISGGQGIVMNAASGTTLEKLTLTYSLNTGLHMSDVHGVTINQCVVRDSAQAGIVADSGSTELILHVTTISDCQGNGFDLQANGIQLKDSVAQHNGGIGVNIANSTDAHIQRMIVDNNSSNGIFVDSSVERIHVESCRVMGNGGIGCVDNGATLATWMNNLASGNMQDDYQNIKAVLVSKATSFWHNVYGN
jgi:hypothetical protein